MFFDDHKKAAQTLIGRRDHRGERIAQPTEMKAEIVKTEDGEVDGRHTAMQDFMSAHKEGSAAKMAQALSNFMDIHSGMGHDASDPDAE